MNTFKSGMSYKNTFLFDLYMVFFAWGEAISHLQNVFFENKFPSS